ncbi:hypothetical protein Tco_0890597 [Tanacetum coccineum]|uniref:Uncharacterized protein n=1 Tax=Tanacetum coccineum TaxID=301880 RepID=A0ABQ5C0W1_9ASTR
MYDYKNTSAGETKNLKKTSQAPKDGYQWGTSNLDNNGANSSGSSFWNVKNSSTSTTPIMDKIRKFENLVIDGQAILVDEAGNLLKKVEYLGDHDSEDEKVEGSLDERWSIVADVGKDKLVELVNWIGIKCDILKLLESAGRSESGASFFSLPFEMLLLGKSQLSLLSFQKKDGSFDEWWSIVADACNGITVIEVAAYR